MKTGYQLGDLISWKKGRDIGIIEEINKEDRYYEVYWIKKKIITRENYYSIEDEYDWSDYDDSDDFELLLLCERREQDRRKTKC